MDQIGKLYQNRAMVLQEEVNRLEKLLEAVVQDTRPRPEALQKEMAAKQAQRENETSRGRVPEVKPEYTSVTSDNDRQLSPTYDTRVLQSDPAAQNAFSKYLENSGVSRVASSIQNIKELPGEVYDKHPLLSLGAAAYSAVPGGAYRAGLDAFNALRYGWINPRPGKPEASWKSTNPGSDPVRATRTQMTELERLNSQATIDAELANREARARALGASPPIAPAPPKPAPTAVSVNTLFQEPKPATPSTILGGNYEAPTFPKLFDKPAKPTNLAQSVSREIFQGMKPGGLWGLGTRTVADSINDIRMDEWLAQHKPSAEAAVIGHGIGIDDAKLTTMRQDIPNIPAGPDRDLAINTANELEKSIQKRTTQLGNLNATATAGENAIAAAKQPSKPLPNIFEPIKSATSKFDVTPWAQRYLNPLTRMGARNIAKGGAGIAGDLVAGEATERGLRAMGATDEDAIGLARSMVGGGVGTATVLGLAGAAVTFPAVVTGAAIAGSAYGLQKGAEKFSKWSGLEDQISGMAAIRKTPGMTRGELEAKHPSTDPDLDDKTKAEYAEAAAAYLRRQADKSGQAVQARSQDNRRTGPSKQ